MTVGKKKATFYLPEDLLRATRVHAARTDRRESQVVEAALRALLGFDEGAGTWGEPDVEHSPDGTPARPDTPAPVSEQAPATQPPEADEIAPPLDPDEALSLAIAELHALREERGAGRR